MHFLTHTLLLAQATADTEAVTREIARLQKNYFWLSWGLVAAWVILAIYVLMMVSREHKLKGEIARLRAMLEEKPRG